MNKLNCLQHSVKGLSTYIHLIGGQKENSLHIILYKQGRIQKELKGVLCRISPPPWPNFATFFVPNTQLSKKKRERRVQNKFSTTFFPFLQIYVWYFSSMGVQTLMFLHYVTLSLVQVQSVAPPLNPSGGGGECPLATPL